MGGTELGGGTVFLVVFGWSPDNLLVVVVVLVVAAGSCPYRVLILIKSQNQ